MTSAAPKHRQQHAEKAAFNKTVFIPFSPTGISRWEWVRQEMVKKQLWPLQPGQCREEGHRHLAWGQLRLLSPGNKIFSLVPDGSQLLSLLLPLYTE